MFISPPAKQRYATIEVRQCEQAFLDKALIIEHPTEALDYRASVIEALGYRASVIEALGYGLFQVGFKYDHFVSKFEVMFQVIT